MKFEAIIKKKIEVPELGVIVPGQVFEVGDEKFLAIFQDKTLFKQVVKKVVKKVKDGE